MGRFLAAISTHIFGARPHPPIHQAATQKFISMRVVPQPWNLDQMLWCFLTASWPRKGQEERAWSLASASSEDRNESRTIALAHRLSRVHMLKPPIVAAVAAFFLWCVQPLVLSAAQVTPREVPPKGYRFPIDADYGGDWKEFRASVPVPFHTSADFDGNGSTDDAWIVLAERGNGWALVAFMRAATGQMRVVTLLTDSGKTSAQSMGMTLVGPGRYETTCGKGYRDCEPNEPNALNLRLPSFTFFLYESASSIFWWDADAKQFRRTVISD
jgi:hypothetical protein